MDYTFPSKIFSADNFSPAFVKLVRKDSKKMFRPEKRSLELTQRKTYSRGSRPTAVPPRAVLRLENFRRYTLSQDSSQAKFFVSVCMIQVDPKLLRGVPSPETQATRIRP